MDTIPSNYWELGNSFGTVCWANKSDLEVEIYIKNIWNTSTFFAEYLNLWESNLFILSSTLCSMDSISRICSILKFFKTLL